MQLYEPREDSELLAKHVNEHAKGICLDVGTGSGIQALEAAKNKNVKKVIAVDIQKEVIERCKEKIKSKKIEFIASDLFQNVSGKFDTIIFNPPYLPEDIRVKDLTVDGGKKGYEVLERFFSEANNFLNEDGVILIVFSSLTKKEKVDEFIAKNLLEKQELEKSKIFFETLYVYLIKKSELLKELEKDGVTNVKYFTKGHRGILFTGIHKNRKVVIKSKLKESKAVGRIENEAKWLKALNKKSIGPKLIKSAKDYFFYEFVEGDFIFDYLERSKKEEIKKTLKELFRQLFCLDILGVNKEEMHHPIKHIIIGTTPVLLDFERCHITLKPKNVTQFCQFLMSDNVSNILKEKGITIKKEELKRLAGEYKEGLKKLTIKS